MEKHLDAIPLPVNGRARRPRRRLRFATAGLTSLLVLAVFASKYHKAAIPLPRHHLTVAEREKLFLSIPEAESARASSRRYATYPHLAGSAADYDDAKEILRIFQEELGIRPPHEQPIFSAGTPDSQNAVLSLTGDKRSKKPNAWIDVYYPVLNTGTEQALKIVDADGKDLWTADLVEDGDPLDETAHKYRDSIPTWHGLSADGDVTGQLIYANYGYKEDYDQLVAKGVNFTGKIVITRYGSNFRGLKIKGAQELGAAGVLIYSDPRDDGYVTVENGFAAYPRGPARNPTSVQRGSVQFLSSYPGDPTTPGYPAYENSTRTEGENIPKIPSLPVSWANAQRLLKEIGEVEVVNKDGHVELTGKTSENLVRLVNHVDTKVTPIWNTMASIPGHIKDEVVIIGCHRDAWVMGAADPTSGTVSLIEIVRGFGALLKKGWKPLRTILIASWDGEEYGLVGSTEWGEDFAEWLSNNTAAYLNVDVSVAGSTYVVLGSPSLAHVINQVDKEIPHPTDPTKTLFDARKDEGPYKDSDLTIDKAFLSSYEKSRKELFDSETGISPLGSGSDFTVFLQRLGIASQDQSFSPTPSDPVYHYHSIYDSEYFQENFADPTFQRHVAISKHLGLLALRLTDSVVIPLNTTQYALELDSYLDKVEALLPTLNEGAEDVVNLSSVRKAIQDVRKASALLDQEKKEAEQDFLRLLKRMPSPPRSQSDVPTLWDSVLSQAKRYLKVESDSVDVVESPQDEPYYPEEVLGYATSVSPHTYGHLDGTLLRSSFPYPFPIFEFLKAAKRVGRSNKKLIAFERGFISKEGIKDREWYKHLGVAPGKWLGYGATTFPALTEAVLYEKNPDLIRHEAERLEQLLTGIALSITP